MNPEPRVEAVRALGMCCEITDLAHGGVVRHAAAYARATDSVWCRIRPSRAMRKSRVDHAGLHDSGSGSLEQMRDLGRKRPAHIFLQAGMGSFAAPCWAFSPLRRVAAAPLAISVKPHNAGCVFRSVRARHGRTRSADGDPAHHDGQAGLRRGQHAGLGDYGNIFSPHVRTAWWITACAC